MTFEHNLRNDYTEFLKKDLPDANKARKMFQEIAYNDLSMPIFAKETTEIVGKN